MVISARNYTLTDIMKIYLISIAVVAVSVFSFKINYLVFNYVLLKIYKI